MTRQSVRLAIAAALVLLVVGAPPAAAQITTGVVTGVIKDDQGR